jgi:hypothetical protein
LKINESKQDVSSLLKAVEFFGAAGEFYCHTLHGPQISKGFVGHAG